MKVYIDIPYEDIRDALITALEGGSNYWYYLPDISMIPKNDKYLSERIIDYLFDNPRKSIIVHDIENEDFLGYFSFDNIKKGLQYFNILLWEK